MSGTGQSGDLRLHRVAPDAYLWRAYFSNAVGLALPRRVLLVDTLISPEMARRMRRDLDAATGTPISHVVLTHFHGDHVGGTSVFADAEIIASSTTAAWMRERDGERRRYTEAFGFITHGFPPVSEPTRTFDGDHLEFELDGEIFQVLRLGATETEDACVVWWPRRRILVSGDGLSTRGYPFLGAPIGDEGLQDDGRWIGALERMRALEPEVVLPGHGPPLVGARKIRARIGRVRDLFRDLLDVVREEMSRTSDLDAIVASSLVRLSKYDGKKDLAQNVLGQRHAVMRAYHALSPDRRGRGWWDDLRPRAFDLRDPHETDAAKVLADRAWIMLERGARCRSALDGVDFLRESVRAATRAREVDPSEARALAVLGVLEVWSAIVLGQPMDRGIELLHTALDGGRLSAREARVARFFVGKAHQFDDRPAEADAWFRQAIPAFARPAYPLLRGRLRSIP